jgi:tetratricopeptide (TPR) repeat protein
VKVEELPVPSAAPTDRPALASGGHPIPAEAGPAASRAAEFAPPAPPAGPPPGPVPDLRSYHARLDPTLRGGTRPAREDYDAAARAARAAEQAEPGKPGARALELYALGGLAYVDRRDDEALEKLLAAENAGGRVGPWDLRVLRTVRDRARGGSGAMGWELALAYGDARREAEGLIAADLKRDPNDPHALLGNAALLRLEHKGDAAVAEARKVWSSHPPLPLAAAAAELIADEEASRGGFEEAADWYRKASIPMSPSTSRAGWEGGRLLEEKLNRPDEARELFIAACKAQNPKACERVGERPRPRLFPRRRGP